MVTTMHSKSCSLPTKNISQPTMCEVLDMLTAFLDGCRDAKACGAWPADDRRAWGKRVGALRGRDWLSVPLKRLRHVWISAQDTLILWLREGQTGVLVRTPVRRRQVGIVAFIKVLDDDAGRFSSRMASWFSLQ